MCKARYSDQEIVNTVRQAEAGVPVIEIVRELGISEATFYAWLKRVDRLRAHGILQFEDESGRPNPPLLA